MNVPARRPHLIDIGEVAAMLAARISTLAPELLPNGVRQGHEWVVGSPAGEKGTQMAVHISGAKAGVWKWFAGAPTDKGDALDLVAAVLFHGDKSKALQWSRRWLGLDTGDPAAIETARRQIPDPAVAAAKARQEQESARSAGLRIWLAAQANVKDTPVDLYLRGRGIVLAELSRQPGAIRFHPSLWHKESNRKWPAMVTAISGPGGFLSCHRTYLEVQQDGSVKKAPLGKLTKMTLGSFIGGHIAIWRGATGKSLRDAKPGETVDITEGVEDGLSVAVAAPELRVIAAVTLGNLADLLLPPAITAIRIWRQNDTKPQPIAAFDKAVRVHLAAGREVIIPPIPRDVKDVNDLLSGGGDHG